MSRMLGIVTLILTVFLCCLSFIPSGTGRVMQGAAIPVSSTFIPVQYRTDWPAANKQVFQAFHQFTFDDL